MSEYQVRILPAAWEDLAQIEVWYALRFDTDTAIKVSSSILDAIERLETHPESGTRTPDETLNGLGYRMIICKYHAAIYKTVEKTIYIYHIADMRTDYMKTIRGTLPG